MKNILFIAVLSLYFVKCKQQQNETHATELPVTWPKDMIFTIYKGGGMVPESETIVIRSDSAWYEKLYNQARNKYYFELTSEDRNLLLEKFRATGLVKMKMEEHPVIYDKGSLSMSLRWDKHNFNFSEGATESIAKKDQENYFEVYNFVSGFVAERVNKNSRPFTIVLDKSIFDSGAEVYFSFQSAPFQYSSKEEGPKNKLTYEILPGEHEAQLNLVNPDHLKNNTPMYYANYLLNIDTRKYNQVKFFMKDKTIMIDTVLSR